MVSIVHSCFLIIEQPSIPECVAATKYEKIGNTYSGRLSARILCLLNPRGLNSNFNLSDIGKTRFLYFSNY